MAPTIYVLTNYAFNHNSSGYRDKPLDARFLNSDKHYVYYLIDDTVPEPLQGKPVLFEKQIDPVLARAGMRHLAEWSFLLAEAKHGFCEYPFFMISSRFYEKNEVLQSDLSAQWDTIFAYLQQYGWGYLPSYNRPLRWIEYDWSKHTTRASRAASYPLNLFSELTFQLIDQLYGVKIPEEYTALSDLQCNYIGFQSKQHLLEYVNFYLPLINTFFDEEYNPKTDYSKYVGSGTHYRNEKPFTFYLEFVSHLFFFKKCHKVFAFHYDGYYEVDERNRALRRLAKVAAPWPQRIRWHCQWTFWRVRSFLYDRYNELPHPVRQVYRKGKASLKAMLRQVAPAKKT